MLISNMLKEKTDKMIGKILECDNCGEGIGLDTKDLEAVSKFKTEHKECRKPKNPNL